MKTILPLLRPGTLAAAIVLSAAASARAEDAASPTADKSSYSLFHPVPENLLRDFDPDRPSKSVSARTLDAGHFEVESDFLRVTLDGSGSHRSETWSWGATNLRVGLTNDIEFQLNVPFYESQSGNGTHGSGVGDLTANAIVNFWGNDTDGSAGGLNLFLKIPTAAGGLGNGKVEGGAAFLFEGSLPWDIDFAFNTGAAVAEAGRGLTAELINIVTLSHGIVGPLSGYVEFYSAIPVNDTPDWEGTVDVGLTLKVGKNCEIDAGLNIGVTPGADRLEPFAGFSYRF